MPTMPGDTGRTYIITSHHGGQALSLRIDGHRWWIGHVCTTTSHSGEPRTFYELPVLGRVAHCGVCGYNAQVSGP